MAVRQFDGVDDDIRHAVGSALADMAYGTFAALIKPQAPLDEFGTILSLVTSGNVLRVQWYYDDTTSWADLFVPTRTTEVDLPNYGNQWVLLVARKASGSVPVTYSLYRFNQGQWTHASSSNFANWSTPGANGQVRRSDDATEQHFRGLIAVQAVWANRVPFANNTAVQNAGLHQSLQAWLDAEPDALWAFNQGSAADPVDDLVGDAHQVTRVGTAVVADDDPPGFDWGDEEEVPELTATLAVELNLAGDAATPPATIPEVSSALDVAVDFAGAAETPPASVPELAGALDLEVDLGGTLDPPTASVPELAGALDLEVDLGGTLDVPSATVPELAGSIDLEVDLGGTLDVPAAGVPELAGALDLEVDLGGILDPPSASIPEVSGTLGIEADLGGILDPPSATVPQVAGSLDLEIELSGELSQPTALVPVTSGKLALIADLGGRIHLPPVEFVEGTGRTTVAINLGRAEARVTTNLGRAETTVATNLGRAEARVASGRSKARTP